MRRGQGYSPFTAPRSQHPDVFTSHLQPGLPSDQQPQLFLWLPGLMRHPERTTWEWLAYNPALWIHHYVSSASFL